MKLRDSNESVLKELVDRHKICWEVWGEEISVQGRIRKVGFQLELYGTHEPSVRHPAPGCSHCQRIYLALCRIADWIMPKDPRPSFYSIEPYDRALHYSPARRNRPDVQLTIKILHSEPLEGPVDQCQVRCLKEMKDHLRSLGAFEREWHKNGRERNG